MKLSIYVSQMEISYAKLATMIGSISGVSLYRYANGIRKPTTTIVKKITEITGGKVTAEDFNNIKPVTKKKRRERSAHLKWIKYLENSHLNGALEVEYAFTPTYDDLSLPLSAAIRELGPRVERLHDMFFLDGIRTDTRWIIDAANQKRYVEDKPPIFYPNRY
jgi:hypothetical protein